MATKNMAYDHPAYTARQFQVVPLPATAASTSVLKFAAFTSLKIKRIEVIVKVAGTADAAGYDILNGTSSVGSIGVGTNAAAAYGTGLTQDISLSSGGYLDIKTKAASATMATDAVIEFELTPGANVTA
jgi:hypothetical protein